MPKADTSVKWFRGNMVDAPVLCGQVGKLVELLDACLINGFSTRTPDNVVVSGGVATVSIGAGNPYEKHTVLSISGASDTALNGEWRIDASTASGFTFLCPGVSDGVKTGVVVKRAPAGWGRPFGDTNKAVYQSLDPESSELFLRVDDTFATGAYVRGYEEMTSVDAGVNPFPTLAIKPLNAFQWVKSNSANGDARSWLLVASATAIHFCVYFSQYNMVNSTIPAATWNFFGDLTERFFPDDKFACILGAYAASGSPVQITSNSHHLPQTQSADARWIARPAQATGPGPSSPIMQPPGGYLWVTKKLISSTYPNAVGETHFFPPPLVFDSLNPSLSTTHARGFWPGVLSSPLPPAVRSHHTNAELPNGDVVAREAVVSVIGYINDPDGSSEALFKIVGPW